MELNLQQRKKGLQAKIPDIEQTLGVVQFLSARRKRALGEEEETEEMDEDDDIDAMLDGDEDESEKDKPLSTLFELNDTLYAEAKVEENGQVGLWLGVSVGWTPDPRRTLCCCIPWTRRASCSAENSRVRTSPSRRLWKIWSGLRSRSL